MTLEERYTDCGCMSSGAPRRWATSVRPAGRQESPVLCSIAGSSDWNATAWTASIPVGIGRGPAAALWSWLRRRNACC